MSGTALAIDSDPVQLPDAAARAAIATDVGHTLFVEAGAGTGKTTALVDRVVELIRSGVALRDLAAITFTEAAAAELRHRLRQRLDAAGRDGTIPRNTVDELDDAAISTLHAFAQRMLSQFPLEAGLPPAFDVLDEVESTMALRDRFGRFLDELFRRPDIEPVVLQALTAGFRTDRLVELAAIFHDHRDRLAKGPAAPPVAAPIDLDPLLGALDCLLDHAGSCTQGADKLLARLVGDSPNWQQLRDRLLEAVPDGDLAVLHVLANATLPGRRKAGTAAAWPDVERVRADEAAAAEAWRATLSGVRSHVAEVLTDQVRQFTHDFARQRVAAGTLVFHDLLILARDLLRDHPDVRSQLARRWQRLLIDEFQDTDPLQIEMAVLLGASPSGPTPAPAAEDAPTDWADIELDPGRLFFVGDAKQSIYRFRRADIGLYQRVRTQIDTTPIALTANFRSVPGVLEWINAVFEHLFVDPDGSGGQAEHQSLDASRGPIDPTPAVTMLGGERDEPLAEIRSREAAEIAATITAARDQGWPVTDRDGTTRAAKLSDVAILIPTRTVLAHLEQALVHAELPYRVDSASLVWSTQVVRELLAILRAIDQPADAVAVVGALRTSVLACSDQDLASWRHAGGRWVVGTPLPDGVPAEHRVADGLARIERLGQARWWATVAELVDHVAHDLPFFELAVASGRTRDQWRQLRFVIEQARAFDERPEPTLQRFLTWADLQASDDARIKEPALPEDDHDALRILTIHGAKGLEFPITMVCGLNVGPRGLESTAVVWPDDKPKARLGKGFELPGFDDAVARDKTMAGHERRRLLYVAMTRARDHLVVSLHRAADRGVNLSDAAYLERAWLAADPEEALARRVDPLAVEAGPAPADDVPAQTQLFDPDVDAWVAEQATWTAERSALVERLRRAPVYAATAVGRAAADDDKPEPGPDAPTHRLGRAGTAIGRAVHAVLQTVDLADPSGIEALARAQAASEGVPDAEDQIARLARAALDTDLVRAAVTGHYWRELYVAAPLDGVVVEGYIDLLYDDGEGLVIVDYKTDSIRSDDDATATAERYRHQLASYALVLEATTGRTVRGAALLFVAGGVGRTAWIDDLDAAKAEVSAWLSASGD